MLITQITLENFKGVVEAGNQPVQPRAALFSALQPRAFRGEL